MSTTEILDVPVRKKVSSSQNTNREPLETSGSQLAPGVWKTYEKILFRFFFIYFILQAVPLDWKYYRDVLGNGFAFSLHDLFYLARYVPRVVADIPAFADWAILALVAAAGAAVWSAADRSRKEYNGLYYALRVIIRYRLAVALLAYGFIKLFPMQMPHPSLSHLNTAYGDLDAWKLFSISTGIVPGYQAFLGSVEIVAALLLLNRKTATIGTFIILPFTGNVLMSNLAYEGGEYVYALLLITFALFLLVFDINRILRLTSFEKITRPNLYKPVFSNPGLKYSRLALKTAFIFVFVFLYGYQSYAEHREGGYQYNHTAGLKNAAGLYTVAEFRVNNTVIPYTSGTDVFRWKDVVFERWATLSVRSNRHPRLIEANTEEIIDNQAARNYEYTGSAGREYYSYTADTLAHTLTLQGRNVEGQNVSTVLQYTRPDVKTIILQGLSAEHDSLYVVLSRVDKKYLLEEASKAGRQRGLKL